MRFIACKTFARVNAKFVRRSSVQGYKASALIKQMHKYVRARLWHVCVVRVFVYVCTSEEFVVSRRASPVCARYRCNNVYGNEGFIASF